MTMKKTVVVAAMIMLLALSYTEIVAADAFDCIDACQTGCVQRDSRLTARCEQKCVIRCGPDSTTKKDVKAVINW